MTAFIEAENLKKSFGRLYAVNGISLRVEAGEIYGLVGPDGAGKTTTMRLLCGAIRLSDGAVRIGGYSMQTHPEQGRAMIGYLPQRFSLYEDLTVIENLRFFAEVRGVQKDEWQPRCRAILDFVGLSEYVNRQAGKLSGGMKQKLGLAVALVHRPKVLLLDEPTTGVDPVTRQDFWQLLIRLVAEEGVAVLVSTPYMDEAARCHRLGFMREGGLLIQGSPAELRAQFHAQVVEITGRPLPVLKRIAVEDEDVQDAQLFGDRLHMHVTPGSTKAVMGRLEAAIEARGGEISHIQETSPQLEDVFMALAEVHI